MNLKDTLNKHNFKFKKKFGQNFITDGNLLQKIKRIKSMLFVMLMKEIQVHSWIVQFLKEIHIV